MIQAIPGFQLEGWHRGSARAAEGDGAQGAGYSGFAAAHAHADGLVKRAEGKEPAQATEGGEPVGERAFATGSASERRSKAAPDGAGLAEQRAVIDLGAVVHAEVAGEASVADMAAAELRSAQGSTSGTERVAESASVQPRPEPPRAREADRGGDAGPTSTAREVPSTAPPKVEPSRGAAAMGDLRPGVARSEGGADSNAGKGNGDGKANARAAAVPGPGISARHHGAEGPALVVRSESALGPARELGGIVSVAGGARTLNAKWLDRVAGSDRKSVV